jgi:hypothetical protein
MPYTTPLADLPVSWPSADAPIVDQGGKPTPEFRRLLDQLRRYLGPADAALDEVEP